MAKNKAAQALSALRWDKATDAERKAHGIMLNKARNKKLTKAERSDIARMGGIARGVKLRKAKEAKKKATA